MTDIEMIFIILQTYSGLVYEMSLSSPFGTMLSLSDECDRHPQHF